MKVLILLIIAGVVVVSVMWASSPQTHPATPLAREIPSPKFSKGLWWTTRTHRIVQLLDSKRTFDSPLVYTEEVLFHKWEVVGKDTITEKDCWIIEVTENEKKRKQRGEWPPPEKKVKLFVSSENGALQKIEATIKEKGVPDPKTYEREYSGKVPTINAWLPHHRVPLDTPFFPQDWNPAGSPKAVFDVSGGEICQTVVPFLPIVTGGGQKALLITLQHKTHGYRSMLWNDQCPWWVEWRCLYKDGGIKGIWYSRTIDWKGKDGEKDKPKAEK